MALILLCIGVAIMAFNLNYGMRLRKLASGGIIGERMVQLLLMTGLFTLAYVGVGAMVYGRPSDTSLIVLSGILLLGALFVTLVMRLVQEILGALA